MTAKERIAQKAHDMMMHYGIRSVSMSDLAAELGMSKKTLYKSFKDKDELVEAVIKGAVNESQCRCCSDIETAKDAIHEIILAIEMMQEMFTNMNPSVMSDLEKFHPKAYEHFYNHKYNFLSKVIKENISRGIKEGNYREDLDIDIIAKLRVEQVMLPFNQQIFPKNKYRLVEVASAITENFLFGLATLKGHKLILKYQQQRNKKTTNDKK